MFWILAALSQAMPVLDVEDGGACLDREAVAREVALRLPPAWVSDGAPPLALSVQMAAPIAQRAALTVRLEAGTPPEPLLVRTIATTPSDCPDLPALIAVIVARRLEELPREAWERARAPAATQTDPPDPPRRWLALGLGAELGLDRPHYAGRLALDGLLGPPRGFALALGLAGSVARPEPLGPGRVRFSALTAHLGVARPVALRTLTLVPALLASGGLLVASGSDLDDNRRGVAPTLRVGPSLALLLAGGFRVDAGLAIGLVRARARDDASSSATPEPLVRAWLSAGFAWRRKKL
ncbi:MAG: hypothetical protein R3F39_18910 [Myxococcota bacterium]